MKLYDAPGAPNPRRVRVFLAEKGITVPSVMIDMRKGGTKRRFLTKNPSGKIPSWNSTTAVVSASQLRSAVTSGSAAEAVAVRDT
jgi:hypothetical protein